MDTFVSHNAETVYLRLAGTPLGDPIEVGALGQALTVHPAPAGAPAGVSLGSVKACFGHTEGAAGLTGLLAALQPLALRARPAIMHLRSLNPYVSAALGEWGVRHARTAALPRQAAPWVASDPAGLVPGASPEALSGASAFGMSGVNAHALLAAAPAAAAARLGARHCGLAWRRARFWPCPIVHAGLAAAAAAAAAAIVFRMDLTAPALGFLRDHCVSRQPVLPAAALLEAAAAAAQALLGGATAWTPLLLHACVGPARPLPAGGGSGVGAGTDGDALSCTIARAGGAVALASGVTSHLTAALHGSFADRQPEGGPHSESPDPARWPLRGLGALRALVARQLGGPGAGRPAGSCTGSVRLPTRLAPGQFLFHPAALTAAAALCAAGRARGPGQSLVGTLAACAAFQIRPGLPEALPARAHAAATARPAGAAAAYADVLCAAARLTGVRMQAPVGQAARLVDGAPAYQLLWQALAPAFQAPGTPPGPVAAPSPARWLVLSAAPWPAERLCGDAPAWLSVRNLVFRPGPGEDGPAAAAEAGHGRAEVGEQSASGPWGGWGAGGVVHVHGHGQLEAAITRADADHIFCAHAPGDAGAGAPSAAHPPCLPGMTMDLCDKAVNPGGCKCPTCKRCHNSCAQLNGRRRWALACLLSSRVSTALIPHLSGTRCPTAQTGPCAGAAEGDALLWAFRAVLRAAPRARLSLVTHGLHSVGPYAGCAPPAAHAALGALRLGLQASSAPGRPCTVA